MNIVVLNIVEFYVPLLLRSLVKAYLHSREKQLIAVVLTLQVIDNVAMVVLEESSPGTQLWLAWRDILHVLDIACCCAILFPIVWSINHLQQAAAVDGKANNNLHKLQLFRQFYVLVVVYLYCTRILVYLLSAVIAYDQLWLGPAGTELAAYLFYTVTGFKFRPAPDNPYLQVSTEEQGEGLHEYGLVRHDYTEDDLELTALSGSVDHV